MHEFQLRSTALSDTMQAADYMDIAIDSPDADADSDEVDDDQQLRVSDNVLVIEISGPEVHNLSIVDFPGFMRSKLPSRDPELPRWY